MRVTSNMSSDSSIYNIQQSRSRLDKINEQLGSQSNINRPSDDPLDSKLLLDIGDNIKAGNQYLSNISKSSTWQQVTNTALTGMNNVMGLAKGLVASITNGSSDVTVRQNAVSQLKALKQQMVDMGNMQLGDQYLFGGGNNSVPPFNSANNTYAGDDTQLSIEIGKNATLKMNINGNSLLKGAGASPDYGSVDILQTFDDLITAVTGDGVAGSPNEYGDVAGIQAGAQALFDGTRQINNAQSEVASKVARLDSMAKLNNNTKNTLETIYGNIQNVDTAKLAVQLSQQTIAYQATLSATAKISQLSILDYLK